MSASRHTPRTSVTCPRQLNAGALLPFVQHCRRDGIGIVRIGRAVKGEIESNAALAQQLMGSHQYLDALGANEASDEGRARYGMVGRRLGGELIGVDAGARNDRCARSLADAATKHEGNIVGVLRQQPDTRVTGRGAYDREGEVAHQPGLGRARRGDVAEAGDVQDQRLRFVSGQPNRQAAHQDRLQGNGVYGIGPLGVDEAGQLPAHLRLLDGIERAALRIERQRPHAERLQLAEATGGSRGDDDVAAPACAVPQAAV